MFDMEVVATIHKYILEIHDTYKITYYVNHICLKVVATSQSLMRRRTKEPQRQGLARTASSSGDNKILQFKRYFRGCAYMYLKSPEPISNLPKTAEITAGLGKARKTWIQEGAEGKSSHQNNPDLTVHHFFSSFLRSFSPCSTKKTNTFLQESRSGLNLLSFVCLPPKKKYFPNIN